MPSCVLEKYRDIQITRDVYQPMCDGEISHDLRTKLPDIRKQWRILRIQRDIEKTRQLSESNIWVFSRTLGDAIKGKCSPIPLNFRNCKSVLHLRSWLHVSTSSRILSFRRTRPFCGRLQARTPARRSRPDHFSIPASPPLSILPNAFLSRTTSELTHEKPDCGIMAASPAQNNSFRA
jgi:hypothetical protein